MKFFSHLKIRSKLVTGFSVVVLFCCLIVFFGLTGMGGVKKRLDDMHGNLIPSIVTTNDIDRYTQEYRRVYLRYMLENNQKKRNELEARLIKVEQLIHKSLEHFGKFPLKPAEREIYNVILLQVKDFCGISGKIRTAISSGIKYDELADGHQQLKKVSDQMEISIRQLLDFNIKEAEEHFVASNLSYSRLHVWLVFLGMVSVLLAVITSLLITRSIVNPLNTVIDAVSGMKEASKDKARLVEAISNGDLSLDLAVLEPFRVDSEQAGNDESGMLLRTIAGMSEMQHAFDLAFVKMTEVLRHNEQQETLRDWFKNGQSELNNILRGDRSTAELTAQTISFLAEYLRAGVGVFYIYNEKESLLRIAASYAFVRRKRLNDTIALGEGLAGQAAFEKKMICLGSAPAGYLSISSGTGEAKPANIVAVPLVYNNALTGVIEIGSFSVFSDHELKFLEQARAVIAIALSVNMARQQVNDLLEQTRAQAEELQVQQEELQQTNEELEERAEMLESQREEIRAKNHAVEEASSKLQLKADELERVSSYKSEFLANMSHELRTPLNSMMILSSLLKDNREGNLTAKQMEFAATINNAGRDLLNLINDILDLSKIESGHLEFHYEELLLKDICDQLEDLFRPITADKGIDFSVSCERSVPETFTADNQRTQQILKNLLSNACKFTSHGSVTMRVYRPDKVENPLGVPAIGFVVTDTGIGIAAEKQSIIFNAFQQVDGSTSRTYGGTGLGLSISRQLARSMGGEIFLSSEPGKGSSFTLYMPLKADDIKKLPENRQSLQTPPAPEPVRQPKERLPAAETGSSVNFDPLPAPIPDDRNVIQNGGKSILVIEDDLTFARILADMVRERGFAALVAADGESGIAIAEQYQPNAVILDVMLPHIDGWAVMRSLKDNPRTRHIPVHFITCLEERQKAMNMGAIGFVTKPVTSQQLDTVFAALENAIDKTTKRLLIVEDDPVQVQAMLALLEERSVAISVADSGAAAIEQLAKEPFDCIVLDLGLSDMGAFEMLEALKKLNPERRIPVIIHTGRELTHEDELKLHHYAESIIIKGAKSPERLLNEVTLFLHLVESSLDPGKQRMIRAALDKEAMLSGKKVLIVDDDMRNIFSLSSALSEKDIIIYEAENGREALQRLDENPDIDLVLMDIMMPEMDGYEAMRTLRKDPRFHSLPVIALTAKAMKGDREECLKAGASDYIPKPVDMEKLFSLLRVWLYSAG